MNYDGVNNPFITLKKLSGDDSTEFTAKLNTSPPSLANDTYMSNKKKSEHTLYSDNRSDKMRSDDDEISFENYAITLMDIDNILYEYFVNVINPQVDDTGGGILTVPVRHASPERWSSILNDGVYRDDKGQVQKPMIIFTRTSVSKDDSFVYFNRYLSVPFVKKFDKKNMYDKFSSLTNSNRQVEVHNITFPDHVILNYDFTMSTEYVQQMNSLVERINWVSNDYWGDPARFKFRASVDSFSNSVEVPTDDDRIVSTTFSLTVNAYLLPEVFDNTKTSKRNLTNRKVVFGTEIISDKAVNGLESSGDRTKFVLNRKTRELYIAGDIGDETEIRIWNDEEYYAIYINDKKFEIGIDVDDDANDFLMWNKSSENEIKLFKNETVHVEVGNKKVLIETHEHTVEIIKIKYIT